MKRFFFLVICFLGYSYIFSMEDWVPSIRQSRAKEGKQQLDMMFGDAYAVEAPEQGGYDSEDQDDFDRRYLIPALGVAKQLQREQVGAGLRQKIENMQRIAGEANRLRVERPHYRPFDDLDIRSPELIKTFVAIQGMHRLAASIKQKAITCKISLGVKKWPSPTSGLHQTKQGLYLGVEEWPEELYTPWGGVMIFGGGWPKRPEIDMFFNEFRAIVKLKFIKNTGEEGKYYDGSTVRLGTKIKFYKENYETEISRKALEKYRGTDTKIMASLCGCSSWYEVESCFGIELAQPELLERANYRNDNHVQSHWKAMMQAYREEEKQ